MTETEPRTSRRALFTAGAAAVLTLAPVSFARAAGEGGAPGPPGLLGPSGATGATEVLTRTVTGTLPPGAPDFVHLPVQVPRGIRELRVSYAYERPAPPPGTPGNALDIGIFDERGTALGGRGFRGWSGGARTEFFLRGDEATPGYLPGPVRPGTWHIALAPYTVAPQGLPYSVTITLTPGPTAPTPRPVHPPSRAEGRGRAWYRGDCHLHSVHSDGRRTPAEIAALARAAGLDFITTTEHNTPSSHAHWGGLWGDDLLILTGEEATTRNGHVLALGTDPGTHTDWRYRARDQRFPRFAREIRKAGGIVVPAHPHANCLGCGWQFGFGDADAVEVWNGPYTPDDEVSVQMWDKSLMHGGRWTPAMGNSDAHRDPDRVGHPQTVVLADDLSREALLAGIRAGRSYVAESSAVSLGLTVADSRGRTATLGGRLTAPAASPVTVRLTVTGAAPDCTTHLVTDQGTVRTGPSGGLEWATTTSYASYVRAEVRRPPAVPGLPGALVALSNPVFLRTAG
ncbi:CehA/McbA family metallohydrolase [Streptomyces sp. NBC_00237]|uniref:CehA/McbA family metallohydrolase n=1 Tax=Streptomyces sp. NBC_00237 TaxID=2975687 RepID=UPI002252051E|nr:CehA/McbA family metallohydrolase [Streptomyces sp. NBC_00237]MCX5200589.1 CehA/McbA family metallohydrolase [Streptomyces sp. NBC_00237]